MSKTSETIDARHERRMLKQQLFHIRRFVEGEKGVKLSDEHKELKKKYEKLDGFTSWSDFPELWDIGDPNRVKSVYLSVNDPMVTDTDKGNYSRLQGKSYETIVPLVVDEKEEVEVIVPEKKASKKKKGKK